MATKRPRVFMNTSVVFGAVLSQTGGARKLFLLAEAGLLRLVSGPTVLKECEEVVRRKAPGSLSRVAQMLSAANEEVSLPPAKRDIEKALELVHCLPDARALGKAIRAMPDWFVIHDREHFLKGRKHDKLPFEIGTPGDFIQNLKDMLGS
ncbi:MAG: hypothetical protein P8Z37_19460 [Acidobacteriota bacterium]